MNNSLFQIRGVVEGFYGAFYTAPERNDLLSFLSQNGYNLYVYGPKNDRQHRARWREPYPDFIMEQFAETAALSKKLGIDFCYSIGSGVSINYASEEDFQHISSKFKAFYEIGVRTFMIMLDDIKAEFQYDEERRIFKSYGEAHVVLTNKLYHWLKALDQDCKLSICPTDYHGKAPFSDYIFEIGKGLHPEIDICYTGPEICSKEITAQDTAEFADAVKRKPIIWDNYPVNDLGMTAEMHIGPIAGRAASLSKTCKGFIVNTMPQAEASKIPLLTFADYFENPESYDPRTSWEKALKTVGSDENYDALKTFAENSLHSCLGYPEAQRLDTLTTNALQSLRSGESALTSQALAELYQYLDLLDEAGYHLKFRLTNYALRNNLLPWIELMESWAWAGRRAIGILRALEQKEEIGSLLNWLHESTSEVEKHPKRFAGTILLPLIGYAKHKVEDYKGSSL
ncbi:protein O-GlcNAcase [Neobacillus bataviensis]|uniref:protein O-GlcNAcase n=1 Tax=Neobacillus bataviensis TaxID=220685 RepID=UPI001CBC6C42|nr:protein O-GlcNAcase [Neobacillus bataviensis]